MAFAIDGFKATLGAGTRPNLFQVFIDGANELSYFLVTAASLPGRTIGTASAFFRGREYKLAGDMVFAPWTTTIINDTNMTLRSHIEDWMNAYIEDAAVKTPENNPEGTPEGYFGDLIVNQLDKSGTVIRSYRLVQAWPSDISEVPLSFDANDQISSFTCTWQYQTIELLAGVEYAASPSGGAPSGGLDSPDLQA